MTATTHPIQPIVYGRDDSGRPAAVDPSGDSPHVLITGGTGCGLTTLADVIATQAARNGSLVSSCHPRREEADILGCGAMAQGVSLGLEETIRLVTQARHEMDDRLAAIGADAAAFRWPRGAGGVTAGFGLEETIRLITQARDEMYDRLTAIGGGANPAAFRHALLAVDDYQHLAGAPAAVCDPAITALAEIAALGRAARVTALIATHVLYGLPAEMLESSSTRIILGPLPRTTALRLLGDTARPDVPAGPGNGTAVTGDRPPAVIRVLPDWGGRQ